MRRMLLVAAVVGAVAVLMACQPAVAVTAYASDAEVHCWTTPYVAGTATGSGAAVLQRETGGKWSDWKWYQGASSGESPHTITSTIDSQGRYHLGFAAMAFDGTLHLRARVGSTASNAVTMDVVGC